MAQEVVKALLVELDGNPDRLNKALASAGLEVRKFKDKTEKSTTAVAGGADMMGSKFAGAGRAAASAMETITRTGKASGEAMKQLIAQGSNAALFFGPAGAFVGAAGIAALAIATVFSRTREEIAETQRAAVEAANSLAEMDANALGARKNRLMHGTPFAQDVSAIFDSGDEAKQREALRNRGLDRLRRDQSGRQAMIAALPSMEGYARLKQELDGIQAAMKELEAEESILQPLMNARAKREAEAARVTREAAAATKDATVADRARQKSIEDLRREAEQLASTTQRLVAEQMGAMPERIAAPFDEAIAQARALEAQDFDAAGQRERIAALESARDSALGVARALGEAAAAMAAFDAQTAGGNAPALRSIDALRMAAAGLQMELAELVRDSAPYLKVQGELAKVLKQIAEAEETRRKALAEITGEDAQEAPKAREMAAYAREIQQAADGALQLAQNLGGANAETVSLLRGIAQIAGNLPGLVEAVGAGDFGSIISSALAVGGALSSLVGADPAEQQRQEELRRNTEAIRELTKKAGQLGLGVTGSEASSAAEDLRAFVRGYAPGVGIVAGGRTFSATDQARVAAKAAGLSLSELDDIAAKHGITLNGSIESFLQLINAIDATRMILGEFGTDVDSAKRQAEAEIAMKGITDPLERLAIRQAATAGRSAALDRTTAGLDLGTAEGRAAARANALALLEVMKAGGARLSDDDLGGLNGDQLLEALMGLIEALNDAENASAAAAGSTVGSVSGFRGLTEAAGSQLVDLDRALVRYARDAEVARRDAQSTRLAQLGVLEALLARMSGAIPVPPIGEVGAVRGAAAGALNITLQMATGAIQLAFHTPATDPDGVFDVVRGGLVDTVQDALYTALRQGALAVGDLRVHRD